MMAAAERIRTISVGGAEYDSELGMSDVFSSSIHSEPSLMNTSQISTSSQDSQRLTNPSKSPHNLPSKKVGTSLCRFPKLEECAHFHYERVQLGNILIRLIEDKPDIVVGPTTTSQEQQPQHWFIINVSAGRSEPFLIKRSLQNMQLLDEILHQCVYDRRVSDLQDLREISESMDDEELLDIIDIYLSRLSRIASDSMTCGSVLTWLQLDNKGRRLPVADSDTMLTINTPACGAAYGIRRYVAQACDEISIEVGDMISVIDMPSTAESLWWRGKKNHFQKNQYEVGFFPQSCVAIIGEKVPRHMPLPAPLVGSLAISPTKPVLRKHGKLITFFRSFILARPSRRRLKQSGIYKERVFSCDLGEHLMNSGLDIPQVLKSCAEFIEEFGIVDGVYRLSGITSNIQKLRRCFDEERIPDLTQPEIKQDIHAVTSLLKMYFRELPNPLCTYQLYDNFVEAIQARTDGVEDMRLKMIRQTVRKLPPPHYRTLRYLAYHLYRIAKHSSKTGMTERNIAIVWAPNLLRSPALESGGVAALRGVGVQAVVTEYLIVNSEAIFDDSNDDIDYYNTSQPHSLSDTSSILVEQQRDSSISLSERPKSLGIGPPKLISLEEAQIRKNQRDNDKAMPMIPTSTHNACSSYIEVGGGPSSLPEKYHTVLPVPRSWNKRKTNSWKSIFQRGERRSNSNIKSKFISNPIAAKETVNKIEKKLEGRKELPVIVSASNSTNSSFKEKKLAKSADTLDMGSKSLTAEVVCQRSCSIDSLRTAGHSRSVSHDSYFDLLQSPLRITACPSRELSELVLNFDREEPEMRIFSESESLVSSPKVAKDTTATVPRRILRARPEEYSSGANSVNPSPKKQPRLNLSSPSELKTWATIINEVANENAKEKSVDDESTSCKRYKFEDQLSDLQFIDCNTPEHLVTTVNANTGYTIYTSIQIHNPPSSLYDDQPKQEQHKTIIDTTNTTSSVPMRHESERYSYPVTQYTTFAATKKEDRFSYPIAICTSPQKLDQNDENVYKMNVSESPSPPLLHSNSNSNKKANTIDISSPGKNNMQDVQRSTSEIFNTSPSCEMTKSKLSIATPQSPVKSPCYSLLIASTASSANSSPTNTPIQDDMDICHHYEPISFNSQCSSNNNAKDDITVTQVNEKKLLKKKNDLSLDLNKSSKINVTSSPNTPQNILQTTASDETANTSQSVTPSEIHYENLFNRQSLTPEISPRVDEQTMKIIKPTIVHVSSGKSSPIKSTISITYNIKSPSSVKSDDGSEVQKFFGDNDNDNDKCNKEGLLETTFDDSMVYEQVKFFRHAVEEVNELVTEDNQEIVDEKLQEVPNNENNNNNKEEDEADAEEQYEIVFKDDKIMLPDVQMSDEDKKKKNDVVKEDEDARLETPDSLEFDQNLSLYENVEIKKPSRIYENVPLPSSLSSSPVRQVQIKTVDKVEEKSSPTSTANFNNVRKLATKFETSPIEVQPGSEFIRSPSHRVRPEVQMRKSNRDLYAITRSLDENAFIREFGSAKKFEEFNKSINEIAELNNAVNRRNSSSDYSKPKVLNQPKKLPGFSSKIPEVHENFKKSVDSADGSGHKLKLNIGEELSERQPLQTFNVRITPTTENRISLIQSNFEGCLEKKTASDEEKSTSTTSLTSLKMLKLDRDRIDKIKEERRHQLNEKYRSESFRNLNNNVKLSKPKSRQEIDIDDFTDDMCTTHRFKSKSRSELDYEQPMSLINTTSSSTNNLNTSSNNQRVRRISDEKNQNDIDSGIDDSQVVLRGKEGVYESGRKKNIDKKCSFDAHVTNNRERSSSSQYGNRHSQNNSNQSDRYSPQISIKDVAAIFESRASQQMN